MNPWIALGLLLLGAGVGSLVSAALHVKEIRKLKELLKTVHSSNVRTESKDQCHEAHKRKSA
jgi:hypothetical protein